MAEPRTLIDLLELAGTRGGSAPFVSASDGLRTAVWTAAGLRRDVRAIAGHLRHELRLDPGARVIIIAPNSPRTVAAHMGCMLAGLIPVPLDLGSSADFIGKVRRKTEARLVLAAGGRTYGLDCPVLDPASLDIDSCPAFEGAGPNADDVAEIVFTSGTTGDPKGTVLSHRNIVANVMSASAIVPPDVPIHLLSILPLSHMLEQTVGLYLPMLSGGTVHYMAGLQPPVILREMRRHRVTGVAVVPRFLDMLMRSIENAIEQRGLSARLERARNIARHLPIDMRRHLFRGLHREIGGRLAFFLCGGASLPPALGEAWETLGVRVLEGYGSTECSPVIASNTYGERHLGTIGRPITGVEAKLSDEGELLARGPNVSRGYWQDEERTAAAFLPGGWFRTGDMAEIADDGIITITGRLGDRIVLPSGQKVFPADIEEEFRKQPEVRDCVVVALADAKGTERLHAAIRLNDGVDPSPDTLSLIVRGANDHLATHQRIAAHTLWTAGDFPRTALGKIKRKEVLSTLQAGHDGAAPKSAATASQGLDRLAAILHAQCGDPAGPITGTTDLATDLGLDSLGRVELAARIEAELGVELPETELAEVATVADLMQLIAEGGGGEKPPPGPEWPLSSGARAVRAGLQRLALFPACRFFCTSFRVEGAANLQGLGGPLLLIPNHTSHADTVAVLRALPDRLRSRTAVAAAADYFYLYRFVGIATSLLLNTFAFSRTGNVRASLERCGELADRGWSILIYPEGSRSSDGKLMPFKPGIGLLAKGLHVPVVPINVEGAFAILPKGSALPRRSPVTVRLGKPVTIDPDASAAEITAMLHAQVASLLPSQRNDMP